MAEFMNKKYKDMSRREKFKLDEYLTRELWNKQKTSITCPICGGTIVTKDEGSVSLTDCSTLDCVHIIVRGL